MATTGGCWPWGARDAEKMEIDGGTVVEEREGRRNDVEHWSKRHVFDCSK
jgi:hypothetical protein